MVCRRKQGFLVIVNCFKLCFLQPSLDGFKVVKGFLGDLIAKVARRISEIVGLAKDGDHNRELLHMPR